MLSIRADFVPGVRVAGFVSYQSPWLHFKRNPDDYILYFIKSGELHIAEDGTAYRLKRGDALLLESGLEHEGIEKRACDYFYIHFRHPDIRRQDDLDPIALARRTLLQQDAGPEQEQDGEHARYYVPKFMSLLGKPYLHQTLHALGELLQLNGRRQYNRHLIALKFAELLVGLGRQHLTEAFASSGGNGAKALVKVNGLLEYIHQNYARRITGEEIERAFDGNFDYLNRVFRQTTGLPIIRYINRVRIGHAKELIQATPLSFAEIGYLTGLSDPYYFSKVFRKHAGMSPTGYYRSVRENRTD
ncbi:AraC family transcriptional regulator [Cohnella sp. JJ-181]|uniref:AraC family transcriptional regulator n=1 Tax=Cohnella rhizoplanae TaxID=2974897 RepID=UPI0022FF9C2F|nr:AraC family transcriptional regulator [Cohnella sp. JJ-181]CAI6066389.1 HTH-type transcriptional activator RhaR [Cohnella sp. JJ-181]